ncbi:hypothetical protein O181_126469 [Austropuccinia psidii MF-1]|uniref:Uncharacterized protein n=1 Tax=Austropuccinia psidii MF-1 TaxID=1389203 RepID=A0A9Q3KTE8_9BASI|nr:hypothetical protein [Austropuccinia psidii MF-1]
MGDKLLGPFTITALIVKNAVEVRLTEEFSRKNPVFPVRLVNSYHQTGEDNFASRRQIQISKYIVEADSSWGQVKIIIKSRNIRLNDKDHRQYLVRFQTQIADKDKLLAEDAIPNGSLHLGRLRAFERTSNFHQ